MDTLNHQKITLLPAPPGLLLALCDVADHQADIFPEELATQTNAVPKRLNEFSTGRFLAHALQEQAGAPRASILPNADRSPIWPLGTKGSISHATRLAAAAFTLESTIDSIGVDIEPLANRVAQLSGQLLTENEITALDELRTTTTEPETLIFSAKEAVYKAIYPLARQMIEFKEVEITPNPNNHTFTATYLPSPTNLTAPNSRLNAGKGYYCDIDGHVITLFVIAPV